MKPAPHQERLSTDQVSKPRKSSLVFQRAAITTVQIGNLVRLKILKSQACTDVERGLIQIGDEEMSFCGVGNGKSQSCPWSVRVERPFVVPGTKHPEPLPAEGAGEQPVHFVQAPNHLGVYLSQHLPPQIPVKVGV